MSVRPKPGSTPKAKKIRKIRENPPASAAQPAKPGDPRRRYIKLDPSLKKVLTRVGACGACSITLSDAREEVSESASFMQCVAPASEPQRSLLPSEVMIVDI
ncbi:MAG: hypothetical protein K2L17_07780 [Muribaculaceae bacterium]|nr:hypothetical protein [Muribaculaceae bacterium]